MPEYLTPGVYLEETSFRSRSIEGVPTSTFGMAGLTCYGPVAYQLATPSVTMIPKPMLVTSYTEFERAFGSLDDVGTGTDTRNYLAYAARAFFDNGGRRLYVSRVFPFTTGANGIDVDADFAKLPLAGGVATWRARWPGAAGHRISVLVNFQRSKNILVTSNGVSTLKGVSPGAAVEIVPDRTAIPKDNVLPANIRIVDAGPNRVLGYRNNGGIDPVTDDGQLAVCHITLSVTVQMGDVRFDAYTGLELDDKSSRSIYRVMHSEQPTDELSLIWLDPTQPVANPQPPPPTPLAVLQALLALNTPTFLTGGSDGLPLDPDALKGEPSDPDDARKAATGLAALGEIDDVAIVATPDSVRFGTVAEQKTAVDNLIEHCERLRYRIGIVDPPPNESISGVRDFRSQFDTKYAALYYPWVEILDPTAKNDPGAAPVTLQLPPSGFAAGIYARSDTNRGVHKAPANEVVLGITRFLQNVTYDRQSVLNPEGINALRFFPGRSNRVWGARTMSSDPEWKYVNVRRLFIYLEHSIDKSTQWAVFEPNNEALWANIRQTITDFLLVTWRTGALMGTKPEEAFFVRCDRTTMTQNDLDNGRLICLIGVAPTYPAEFVVFRIGQFTASARQS
ncbi:phage tail sheath family protein [Jatrophihabitans sp.]|uniref:phage tail sheath family protein n=1 Tax=Jatrophihabitans sp. TaxID=1932789 RepID=UPI002D0891C1|nr:phage tail sheath subtilisin-like domain-containing protein [Jatrophihabitans sp.]